MNIWPQAEGLHIFWWVQHSPALTYLRKTKGKLGSKYTEKSGKPNVSWVWNKLIGHRTPQIPDQEVILQAYAEVQMTQRVLEKKCTNTKHVEDIYMFSFYLNDIFFPILMRFCLNYQNTTDSESLKQTKNGVTSKRYFRDTQQKKKPPNNLKLKKGIWWIMWIQQGKTSAWTSLDWNTPFWKYNFLFCTYAKQLILKYSSLQ